MRKKSDKCEDVNNTDLSGEHSKNEQSKTSLLPGKNICHNVMLSRVSDKSGQQTSVKDYLSSNVDISKEVKGKEFVQEVENGVKMPPLSKHGRRPKPKVVPSDIIQNPFDKPRKKKKKLPDKLMDSSDDLKLPLETDSTRNKMKDFEKKSSKSEVFTPSETNSQKPKPKTKSKKLKVQLDTETQREKVQRLKNPKTKSKILISETDTKTNKQKHIFEPSEIKTNIEKQPELQSKRSASTINRLGGNTSNQPEENSVLSMEYLFPSSTEFMLENPHTVKDKTPACIKPPKRSPGRPPGSKNKIKTQISSLTSQGIGCPKVGKRGRPKIQKKRGRPPKPAKEVTFKVKRPVGRPRTRPVFTVIPKRPVGRPSLELKKMSRILLSQEKRGRGRPPGTFKKKLVKTSVKKSCSAAEPHTAISSDQTLTSVIPLCQNLPVLSSRSPSTNSINSMLLINTEYATTTGKRCPGPPARFSDFTVTAQKKSPKSKTEKPMQKDDSAVQAPQVKRGPGRPPKRSASPVAAVLPEFELGSRFTVEKIPDTPDSAKSSNQNIAKDIEAKLTQVSSRKSVLKPATFVTAKRGPGRPPKHQKHFLSQKGKSVTPSDPHLVDPVAGRNLFDLFQNGAPNLLNFMAPGAMQYLPNPTLVHKTFWDLATLRLGKMPGLDVTSNQSTVQAQDESPESCSGFKKKRGPGRPKKYSSPESIANQTKFPLSPLSEKLEPVVSETQMFRSPSSSFEDTDFTSLIQSVNNSIQSQFHGELNSDECILSDLANRANSNSQGESSPVLSFGPPRISPPNTCIKKQVPKNKKSKVHVMMRSGKRKKRKIKCTKTPLSVVMPSQPEAEPVSPTSLISEKFPEPVLAQDEDGPPILEKQSDILSMQCDISEVEIMEVPAPPIENSSLCQPISITLPEPEDTLPGPCLSPTSPPNIGPPIIFPHKSKSCHKKMRKIKKRLKHFRSKHKNIVDPVFMDDLASITSSVGSLVIGGKTKPFRLLMDENWHAPPTVSNQENREVTGVTLLNIESNMRLPAMQELSLEQEKVQKQQKKKTIVPKVNTSSVKVDENLKTEVNITQPKEQFEANMDAIDNTSSTCKLTNSSSEVNLISTQSKSNISHVGNVSSSISDPKHMKEKDSYSCSISSKPVNAEAKEASIDVNKGGIKNDGHVSIDPAKNEKLDISSKKVKKSSPNVLPERTEKPKRKASLAVAETISKVIRRSSKSSESITKARKGSSAEKVVDKSCKTDSKAKSDACESGHGCSSSGCKSNSLNDISKSSDELVTVKKPSQLSETVCSEKPEVTRGRKASQSNESTNKPVDTVKPKKGTVDSASKALEKAKRTRRKKSIDGDSKISSLQNRAQCLPLKKRHKLLMSAAAAAEHPTSDTKTVAATSELPESDADEKKRGRPRRSVTSENQKNGAAELQSNGRWHCCLDCFVLDT